ncbi:MAG: SpoIIE family protein phosphatase [Prevotellaceae bacterium]|nr:SpoIIE family protein phosphatase [Candidatus Colivivens equi]
MMFKFSKPISSVVFKISAYVVGVVLLYYIIMSVITVQTAYQKSVRQTYNEISTVMGWSLDWIDARLQIVETVTNTMSNGARYVLHDPKLVKEFLENVLNSCEDISAVTIEYLPGAVTGISSEYAPTIYIQKETGDTLFIDAVEEGFHYINFENQDENWLAGIKGRSVWSKPYTSVSDKIMRVSYSFPITDSNGKVIAVLCSTLSLDFIQQAFEETKQSKGCQLSVITNRGDYIYQNQNGSSSQGTNILNDSNQKNEEIAAITQKMIRGERGFCKINGKSEYYCYYAPIKRTKWAACYVYPEELIERDATELTKQMVVDGLWLIFIVFVILCIGIYRIIHPFTYNLKKVSESNAAMNQDLKIAAALQKSMVPDNKEKHCKYNQLEIYGLLQPAKMVGGDLFDYFYQQGKVYFCIGDVSGKGVPASMYMAIVRILIKVIAKTESDVDKIVSRLNEHASISDNSMFCTLFLGVIDLATGNVTCCNAGHNYPILIRKKQDTYEADFIKKSTGAAVGVFEDEIYSKFEFSLAPEDMLFLYTDGVIESEDINHKLFGEERTLELMRSISQNDSLEQIVNRVLGRVEYHAQDSLQSDDITMLMMRYSPEDYIELQNDVSETTRLGVWVEIMCDRYGIDRSRLFNIQLAIEEAVVNIIHYAYPNNTAGTIYIKVQHGDNYLSFTIEDTGVPYDPTKNDNPEISQSTEDCQIGGLGIFLYSELVDKVEYNYQDNRNKLVLTIKGCSINSPQK